MAHLMWREYQYSVELWVADLNPDANYTDIYISVNGKTSSNLKQGRSGWTYSKTWEPSLPCGSEFYASYTLYTSGGSSGSGGDYISTTACPIPPPEQPYVDDKITTQTSIELSWTGGNADYYRATIHNSNWGEISSRIVYGDYYDNYSTKFTGLSPNTLYNFEIYGVKGSITGTPTRTSARTDSVPRPVTPSFSSIQNSDGSTSVIAYWGTSSNTNYYIIRCYRVGYGFVKEYETTSRSQRFDNLILGERYYFSLQAVGDGGFGSWVDSETVQLGYAKPTSFKWTYAKNKGGNFNLTASEWISLCSKINDFRKYANPNLGDYPFSNVKTGDTFTHTIYNQARSAIIAMPYDSYWYPIYSASKDEEVTADKVNVLRDALNSVTRS